MSKPVGFEEFIELTMNILLELGIGENEHYEDSIRENGEHIFEVYIGLRKIAKTTGTYDMSKKDIITIWPETPLKITMKGSIKYRKHKTPFDFDDLGNGNYKKELLKSYNWIAQKQIRM